jgi:hypothetical protein
MSSPAQVRWGNHDINTRVIIRFINDVPPSALREISNRRVNIVFKDPLRPRPKVLEHLTGVSAGTWTYDTFLGDVSTRELARADKEFVKHFSLVSSNKVILQDTMILCETLSELSINQIFHCVRGTLPLNFPTIEEFEFFLPKSLREKAEQNFVKLVKAESSGAICNEAFVEPSREEKEAPGTAFSRQWAENNAATQSREWWASIVNVLTPPSIPNPFKAVGGGMY